MRTMWPYLGKESKDALLGEDGPQVPAQPHGLLAVQGQHRDLGARSRDRHQARVANGPLADGSFDHHNQAVPCGLIASELVIIK